MLLNTLPTFVKSIIIFVLQLQLKDTDESVSKK